MEARGHHQVGCLLAVSETTSDTSCYRQLIAEQSNETQNEKDEKIDRPMHTHIHTHTHAYIHTHAQHTHARKH